MAVAPSPGSSNFHLLHGLIRSSGAAPSAGYTCPESLPDWFERLDAAAKTVVGPRLGLAGPDSMAEPLVDRATAAVVPAGVDPMEFWEFDLRGFIVLRALPCYSKQQSHHCLHFSHHNHVCPH